MIGLITLFSFTVYSVDIHALLTDNTQSNFTYYSRKDWNATSSTDKRKLPIPVPYVVIHHTYIPAACYTNDNCSIAMRSMQTYHQSLGWGDIGYNFCVGANGAAYEGRGWENRGIHAGKANNVSVGICLIGDWRTEVPPAKQLETSRQLIARGVAQGFITQDYKLISHKQVKATECPGEALYNEISTWSHFSDEVWPR